MTTLADRHEAVRDRVCASKTPMGRDAARRYAAHVCDTTGDVVRAYRCPFSAGAHWHVGHPPSVEGLRAIAAAIRNLDEPRRLA